MRDRHGAHAAFTALPFDLDDEVTLRAKEKLPSAGGITGAGAAILHANAFIFRAILNVHLLTQPYTAYY